MTRRFAHERGALSHWVPVDPAFPVQDRRISDYAEEHEFVGTFTGQFNDEVDNQPLLVFRPWTVRLSKAARSDALPSSNARLTWRTDIVANGESLNVPIPPRSEWRSYVRKRGRSITLLGAGGLVPDVVGDGRGRHGKARFAGGGCSYDRSYDRSAPGHRVERLRQAPSLDGRAEAQDRGRRHGAGCVGGDGGWQARHQHRAVLCLAATAVAARSARCRKRLRAEFGGH